MNSDSYKKLDFGRYTVLALLGQGGFGAVYEAFDKELNRIVALKTMKEKASVNCLQRFQREVAICTRLRHPNVITIFDALVKDDSAYIVMERLEAEELGRLIEMGEVGEKEALAIVAQIAKAIEYLNREGILHRDIKPENIMVEESGRAVLMDFNLGLVDDLTALTATGTVVGTPRYMAPELWLGRPHSLASEIYALGLVFSYMLSGEPPPIHSGEDVQSGIEPLPAPSTINPKLGKDYDDFIAWVTRADVQLRCDSIEDFLLTLSKTTSLAQETVSKFFPDLKENEKTVSLPEADVPNKEFKGCRRRYYIFALLMSMLVVFLTTYELVLKKETGQKAVEVRVELCSFPDGCCAFIAGSLKEAPKWRVISNKVQVKQGVSYARGRYWLADVQGLMGKGPFLLQLYQRDELVDEREFKLSSKSYEKPIEAYVGLKRVKLKWLLNNDVEALVKGRFTGDEKSKSKLAKGEVSFSTKSNSLYFSYEVFVGKRKIASEQLRLKLVQRLNRKDFPNRPRSKFKTKPLVVSKGILVGDRNYISLWGLERDNKGPVVSLPWHTKDNYLGSPIQFQKENGPWCLCLLLGLGKIKLLRFNCTARIGGSSEVAALGTLPGEWLINVTPNGLSIKNAVAVPLAKGLIAIAVSANDAQSHLYLVEQSQAGAAIVSSLSLPASDALWARKLGGNLQLIKAYKGIVSQAHLSLDANKEFLWQSQWQELFTEEDEGALRIVRAQKPNATTIEQSTKCVELEVSTIAKSRLVIRLGRSVSFWDAAKQKMEQVGPQLTFPTNFAQRISSPLELSDGRVCFAFVELLPSKVPTGQAFLYKVDLTKSAKKSVERLRMDRSIVNSGFEAICGSVVSWGERYYVPALDSIYVVSKLDGELLGTIFAEARPNHAVVAKGTLVVPLNTRKILAMDLLDEF